MVETEERVQTLGLQNTTVLNYHSLGVRYYTSECATDQGLKRVVQDDMPVVDGMVLPDFDVLVMDEQQDMTPILKRFVDKVIRDKGYAGKAAAKKPKRSKAKSEQQSLRVVVLGDRRQELYGFNNADSRFLTMASRPEVFGYINSEGWTSADLTTSRRLTQQNVQFINQQMLKLSSDLSIRAVKYQDEHGISYPRPRYVICDPQKDVLKEVSRLLDSGKNLSPADIIVLAPSVRGSSAALHLANDLALKDIPVFRSDSDHADVVPEVARGKVLICTYHQAKGIERKAAIVMGFDQDYHTWYNKVLLPPTATSNPQYVAATRAVEHLVLIHNYRRESLPFVSLESIEATCEYVKMRKFDIDTRKPTPKLPMRNVSSLCRNLSETLITACLRHLEVHSIQTPAYGVEPSPPSEIIDRHGLLEGISNITGTAITTLFQWMFTHKITNLSTESDLLKLLRPPKRKPIRRDFMRELPKRIYEQLATVKTAHDKGTITKDEILFVSNMKMANIDEDITKLLAMPFETYSWLSDKHVADINYTLSKLPAEASFNGRGFLKFDAKIMRRYFYDPQTGEWTNPIIPNTGHKSAKGAPRELGGFLVSGEMDMCRYPLLRDRDDGTKPMSKRTVWEIKYTMSLQPEHVLQTALYMLLLQDPAATGFLVSVRTGQTVQVKPRAPDSLKKILQLLVDAKSTVNGDGSGRTARMLNTYSDEEFLEECRRDFEGLVDKCALPPWFAAMPSGSKYRRRKAKDQTDAEPPKTKRGKRKKST